MFTGLIAEVGKVVKLEKRSGILRIGIQAIHLMDSTVRLGDSIALNGICMTVVDMSGEVFEVEAMLETLTHTTLEQWKIGTEVNLERAMRLSDRLDGHLVSGHIDGVGEVVRAVSEGGSQRITIRTESKLSPFIASKGSVALDGISLTVASVEPLDSFCISLIPHTLNHTTWNTIRPGMRINIEIDMMARYAIRYFMRDKQSDGLSMSKLIENGF